MKLWIVRALLAFVTLLSTALSAHARPDVDVRLSTLQPVLRGDVDVTVTVTVTNTGRAAVNVLRWQLPDDELESPLFRITHESGSLARYTGRMVKRAAPDANDLVRIEAGATLRYDVELTSLYDLSRNGRYTIDYASREGHGRSSAPLQSGAPLHLWLEGRSAKSTGAGVAAALPAAKSLATVKCTASQTSDIATAVTNAGTLSGGALSYLTAGTAGPRYTTWFGPNDATRYSTVRTHFTNINNAFANAAITVDCSCKKRTVYAFVTKNNPYYITVCGAFWTAPPLGTDSKAGTLVHEMSHFTIVADTDDWAYGQTNAKALATSDPAKAIDNADSHEYFAENTPFQN